MSVPVGFGVPGSLSLSALVGNVRGARPAAVHPPRWVPAVDRVQFGHRPASSGRFEELKALGAYYGIQPEYNDFRISESGLRVLLTAMGVENLDSPALALKQAREAKWKRWVEPVRVLKASKLAGAKGLLLSLNLSHSQREQPFEWTLTMEGGESVRGSFQPKALPVERGAIIDGKPYVRYRLSLPVEGLPPGYHQLEISNGDRKETLRLIVAPERCYNPVKPGGRVWGATAQLYGVRDDEHHDWGMGDFTNLANRAQWAAKEGAALVGLNPLHAMNLSRPEMASPYSPISRLFLNPLYIDVEAVPEFKDWKASNPQGFHRVFNDSFAQKLDALRQAPLVRYREVSRMKLKVLSHLFKKFKAVHLGHNTPRAQAFQAFVKTYDRPDGRNTLTDFATFQALQKRFNGTDWNRWPKRFHEPKRLAVQAFRARNVNRVQFYEYLQWLAHEQLEAAGKSLPLGFYRDMAIGVVAGGFDVWNHQDVFAHGIEVGAPSVQWPRMQKWGFPAFIPHKLREEGYQSFIEAVRANMKPGALRLDHAAFLERLFWVPQPAQPGEGAYVHYNIDELMGILAIESHRNKCVLIGEDVGAIPENLRPKMAEWGMLFYKICRWQREWNAPGQPFIPPSQYTEAALAVAATHDQASLAGMVRHAMPEAWDRLNFRPKDVIRDEILREEETMGRSYAG